MKEKHLEMRVEAVIADKGYDDSENHEGLLAEKIKGVIPKHRGAEIHEDAMLYSRSSGS